MKKPHKGNQYYKLNMPQFIKLILVIFFISISIWQAYEINQLNAELIREQNLIKRLEYNVMDLDSKTSDLEDRLNNIESTVDDFENSQNY